MPSFCFLRGERMPYKTIRAEALDSIVIEKSEFIAKIAPVATSEEAAAFIDSVKAEHRRARHNCYAYTLREGFETRYSDDGEPSGTAGTPILDVIQKSGLSDVCIVVTRYFGGILLGKGGLTRAYSSAAAKAVAAAELKIMCDAREISLNMEYPLYDRVLRLLPEFEVKILDQSFETAVKMQVLCREELCEGFVGAITELSNGQIKVEQSETFYADFA